MNLMCVRAWNSAPVFWMNSLFRATSQPCVVCSESHCAPLDGLERHRGTKGSQRPLCFCHWDAGLTVVATVPRKAAVFKFVFTFVLPGQ